HGLHPTQCWDSSATYERQVNTPAPPGEFHDPVCQTLATTKCSSDDYASARKDFTSAQRRAHAGVAARIQLDLAVPETSRARVPLPRRCPTDRQGIKRGGNHFLRHLHHIAPSSRANQPGYRFFCVGQDISSKAAMVVPTKGRPCPRPHSRSQSSSR